MLVSTGIVDQLAKQYSKEEHAITSINAIFQSNLETISNMHIPPEFYDLVEKNIVYKKDNIDVLQPFEALMGDSFANLISSDADYLKRCLQNTV